MFVIGLTGGIGSGKSTVAKLFSDLGVTVIDTDQLARDLTQPGQPALQKITEQFGRDILEPNGSLNRAALRTIIFADKNKRLWLEKVLHPLIRTEMSRLAASATSPYCIAVIPLLLETSPNPLIDRILVVDAPESLQIQRTQARDGVSSEDIKTILETQIDRAKRLAAADDVIVNDNNLADLIPQVEKLHKVYLELSKAKHSS